MKENEGWRYSGPTAVVLAILAFLGFRSFTSESPKPSSEPATAQRDHSTRGEGDERKDTTNGDRGGKHFWQPLRDFQNTRAPSGLAKEIAGLRNNLTDIDGWDVRYLIACVPDPIDSTSGHRFDGLIDAIQLATQTQGYVFDRSYYPWPRKKADRVTTEGTLTQDQPERGQIHLLAQSVARKHEDEGSSGEPGLLLLRCHNPCRLLLVFLVGETATAGLDKQAFATSLEFIKKLKGYRDKDKRQVPVLGPHFSGSQTSLQQAIEAFAEREMGDRFRRFLADPRFGTFQALASRPTFQIISGNASSIDKRELEHRCPLARVNFHATVVPGEAIMAALYEYLQLGKRQGDGFCFRDNFAILYESNTTFGSSVKKDEPDNDQKGKASNEPKGKAKPEYGPTWFPFPLHVSEVRGAYNQLTGPTRDNVIRLPSFGSKLQLPTRRSSQPHDVEPSLNPDMTAVTSERLLAQMLETIAHERFRYVFIVATDIQDKLFLASLVREYCPESRLVFFESELLFTHPDFSSVLRGSIVGSSYPLYSRDQRWSFPFNQERRRPSFLSSGEQGYYNATILLLSQDQEKKDEKALVEYGPPFPKLYRSSPLPPAIKCPEDISAPTESSEPISSCVDEHRPPVWISIVGVGGLYPVAVVPNRITWDSQGREQDIGYKDYVYRADAKAPEDSDTTEGARFRIFHPGLLIVPVLGITLLLLYVTGSYLAVVLRWPQWHSGKEPQSGTQLQKFFWPRSPRLRWRQQLYAAVCLTSVPVVYVCLVSVWLLPLGHWLLVKDSPVQVRPWQWITPVVLLYVLGFFFATVGVRLGLGVVSLWKAPASVLRLLRRILGERSVIWISLALLLPLVAYLVVNGGWPRGWQPGEALLFADRATALASGVSAVVPIFCIGLAFYAWSYAHLKRLYLLDKPATENPCPPVGDEPLPRIAHWHGEVSRDLRRPRRALYINKGTFLFWFIWIMLFFAFSRLSIHFVPAVEGVVTEALILVSLTVLSTLIVYGWLHLWKVWGSLRQLLNTLALLPLRTAYQRIPTTVTNQLGPYLFPFASYLFSAKPEQQNLLAYRLDQYGLLIAEYPRIAADLKTATALPAPLQDRFTGTLVLVSPDLTRTARDCVSLLEYIHHHPDLAERLLEKAPEEKTDHSSSSPREADHSVNIRKIHTPTPGQNATLEIREEIRPETSVDPAVRHWLARAEDFAALEVAVYLSQLFAQLSNLIIYMSIIPVLFLLAVTSYPFQPQRLWMILGVILIGLVTGSVLWIIFQIERNEMISRIVKTTPNQLNFHWGFLSHVLVYAVPLLGIVVAMSSDVSDLVHSWFDPLLGLMK